MESLFIQLWCKWYININFEKYTLKTGFVVQAHILYINALFYMTSFYIPNPKLNNYLSLLSINTHQIRNSFRGKS